MAEQIRVVTGKLREAAAHHRETAEYLASIPLSHPDIQASLDSLGPIYSGLAEAGRELLEERRSCYESQAAGHADMADGLTVAAETWEQHEQDGAAAFRAVADEH
ncbi:MAG TPA: ESX-1 secretion-associated protein [Mycobacterium sp.]|nr:ESX-1 secretion-associated protein [Mycobacterium sp.]